MYVIDVRAINPSLRNDGSIAYPSEPYIPVPVLTPEQDHLIFKLSQSGLDIEKVFYEVLYDPTYQIAVSEPYNITSNATDDGFNVESLTASVRQNIVHVMNDRLIWSLKRSQVVDVTKDVSHVDVISCLYHLNATIALGLMCSMYASNE